MAQLSKPAQVVLVGAALLAIAPVGVATWMSFQSRDVTTRLPVAVGLHAGSPVKAAGVHAGDVSSVRAEGTMFVVEAELAADVPLRSDACARLITFRNGESYLEIDTGRSPRELESDSVPACAIATAESFVPGFAQAMMSKMDELTRQIEALGASPVVHGSLDDADTPSGDKVLDTYTFEWMTGRNVFIDVRSSEIDPYLIVRSPSGWQQHNDDERVGSANSHLDLTIRESGTWYLQVTSAQPGERGSYELIVR